MSTSRLLTAAEALAVVAEHGIVLESAAGPVPTLTHAIVGERIRGSWWAHPDSHHVYAVLEAVRDSPDILAFRLVGGKVTYAHRRTWAALARLADDLGPQRVTAVDDVHTERGHHRRVETPFPDWLDAATRQEASDMDTSTARAILPAAIFAD